MPELATIVGAQEFSKSLNALPDKVATKYTRAALRAGGKVLQAEMRSLAPKKSGVLASSIVMQASKSRSGMLRLLVGLFQKRFKGKQWYGASEEFGWTAGFQKKVKEPGKHFVERAGNAVAGAAGEACIASLASQLSKDTTNG